MNYDEAKLTVLESLVPKVGDIFRFEDIEVPFYVTIIGVNIERRSVYAIRQDGRFGRPDCRSWQFKNWWMVLNEGLIKPS